MLGSTLRLGDLVDDYCPRCRLLLNHAIASMIDGKVAKVICQTCLSEHPFLHGDDTKRKKPAGGRATLYDQVTTRIAESDPAPSPAPRAKRRSNAPAARYVSRHKGKLPKKPR